MAEARLEERAHFKSICESAPTLAGAGSRRVGAGKRLANSQWLEIDFVSPH
jgi:hypothetical protein